MPASPTYNDGALEYGSALLTITPASGRTLGTSFNVIADATFDFDDACREVDQTNQYGEPYKSFGVPINPSGSCTIQLPSGRRVYAGDTFVADVETDTSPSGTVWIVTRASNPFTKDDYRKQVINYRKRINTP